MGQGKAVKGWERVRMTCAECPGTLPWVRSLSAGQMSHKIKHLQGGAGRTAGICTGSAKDFIACTGGRDRVQGWPGESIGGTGHEAQEAATQREDGGRSRPQVLQRAVPAGAAGACSPGHGNTAYSPALGQSDQGDNRDEFPVDPASLPA